MTLSHVFLILAVILFVWAALVAAETITFGTFGVLFTLGLAAFAGSFLPWRR